MMDNPYIKAKYTVDQIKETMIQVDREIGEMEALFDGVPDAELTPDQKLALEMAHEGYDLNEQIMDAQADLCDLTEALDYLGGLPA